MRQDIVELAVSFKQKISKVRERVVQWNEAGVKGWFQVVHYTKEIDAIIREILKVAFRKTPPSYSVIALGGYGRRELNLCSDLDIMFLWDKPLTSEEEDGINSIIQILWDLGIDIGHSFRSIDEAIRLAGEDDATKCSFLDARLLGGSLNPYAKFSKRFEKFMLHDNPMDFLVTMENWLEERYNRYGSSMYLIEPNIKESPGCLRDLHTIFWIGKQIYRILSFSDLKRKGLLTPMEFETLQEARDFFWRIRNAIHKKRRRKNDVLSVDIQPEVAYSLGYRDVGTLLGVEYFMRDFYSHARNVQRVIKAFILRTKEEFLPEKHKDFYFVKFLLEESFSTPAEFLREVINALDKGLDFERLYRGFWVPPFHWKDADFFTSETREEFVRLLNHERSFRALKFLHEIGFIERLIPEFGKITNLMQFDLYHKFTVDEHTLLSIKNVEELPFVDGAIEQSVKEVYEEILNSGKKYLLTLALLLHDIGKGKGGGHAARGARIAADIMGKMGFSEYEISMVVFLVRNHTVMVEFALRRDLEDPQAISAFAELVGSVERLKMLYVLTYGDVSAISPDSWNDWKAILLHELYVKTLFLLETGKIRDRMEGFDFKLLASEIYRKIGKKIPVSEIEKELSKIPERYLISISPDTLAKILPFMISRDGIFVDYRVDEFGGKTEIIIVKKQHRGDFAKVVGIISSRRFNITSAIVVTLSDGRAIYIVEITDSQFRPIADKRKLQELCRAVKEALEGKLDVEAELRKRHVRLSRRESVLKVEPKVSLNNLVSEQFSVIEVKAQDRMGLLYDISKMLGELGLNIHMAKITTEGNRAVDAFYVTKNGQKIKDIEFPEIIRKLKNSLMS